MDINLGGGRDLEKVWINEDIKQYIKDHKQDFENQLLCQAVNVRDKIRYLKCWGS